MNGDELRAAVNEIGWYHSIDLGGGVVTPGLSQNRIPEDVFPDVQGKTVLDVGAWDGLYSFMAERNGAARVVALDQYVWCLDFAARQAYWEECDRLGVLPDHERDQRDFWRADTMPGRQGFDFAKQVLSSDVEPVVGDLLTADLDALGVFDVVLYLGVLYHVREPLTALTRLRSVTRGVAMIETEAIDVPEHEDEGLCAFFPGNELNRDFGNWYALSERALRGMCLAAGFTRVETEAGPPPRPAPPVRPTWRTRPSGRADYDRVTREQRETRRYRIVVHAYA